MKQFKSIVIVLFFLMQVSISFANNDSSRLKDIEKRVGLLEEYKTNIEYISKVDYQKAKEDIIKDNNDSTKNVKNLFTLILLFGIPSTLYGAYMMFFGLNTKINKAINDKIATIVEQKREDIIKLINNQEFERKLKNSKVILVISPTEEAQEEIKKTMLNFKFKNLIFRIDKKYDIIPTHDLIVFNNCDGELTQLSINEIMDKISDEDICFVAYTSKQLERNPRLNFANSKFTLYHNILTTLSFVESIKSDE